MSFENDPKRLCVVPGCSLPVTAEVYHERKQPAKARSRRTEKIICENMPLLPNSNSQKWRKPLAPLHVCACDEHMRSQDLNKRLGWPQWQLLLVPAEENGREERCHG
jgi:hypothetical protein